MTFQRNQRVICANCPEPTINPRYEQHARVTHFHGDQDGDKIYYLMHPEHEEVWLLWDDETLGESWCPVEYLVPELSSPGRNLLAEKG